MNRHVNAIAGRLSLRPPQRRSLEILDRITEIAPLRKGNDLEAALAVIRSEYPTVTNFERDFPSLCFALATGVGKTRLMGTFISYLHLAHGLNNFFVLAPNLTIYNKLIADFTPNTPKYVFKGIAEFATNPPYVITGDNYEGSAGTLFNDLKPVLGLELTATPFVETSRGAIPFKNVIYDYPLARAMADGFVKEPAVVTRRNFNAATMSAEQIELLKLEDGIRLHESVKVELETYARETGNAIVKPFLLVIARDTTHAGQLIKLIESEAFFEGRYKGRVIQVDSSKTGAEEDEMVARLLKVEHSDEPTEIVIHVNMLKEGWDVTNLYTIVPLRAANARILIEQSIGRGLRLPYGRRTGVTAVDRLNIVAHDKFQEIIDEASRPDSQIRLQQVVLDSDQSQSRTVTVVSQSQLAASLGLQPQQASANTQIPAATPSPVFPSAEEQRVAQMAYAAIRALENQPQRAPGVSYLQAPAIQAEIVKEVASQYTVGQLELEGMLPAVDIAAVVAQTTALVIQQTIDIPRILVIPQGEVRSGYHLFTLDLRALRYPPVDADLWIQHLRTGQRDVLSVGQGGAQEARLEDTVVSGLVDFDDIAYDQHADLLYDLAQQTVAHFRSYLPEEEIGKVLRVYQMPIANLIHVQMQSHFWEDAAGYDVRISSGFSELKPSAYTAARDEAPLDFRVSPADKSNMTRYLFGGFQRCLYTVQKFQSDAERRLAVILERESLKWFKPARGQFQIYYKLGGDHLEYQPDFVAETDDAILMLEPKARNELDSQEVLAKQAAAVTWCQQASTHAHSYGGKAWQYALIPHDVIADNMTLDGLIAQYARSSQ